MAEQKTGLPPVSLAAGSYDAAVLSSGFETAAKAKAEEQPGKFEAAVEDARAGTDTDQRDPALLPDHVYVDVENGHGGTERRQVFSPPLAEAHVGAETGNAGTVIETDEDAEKVRAKAIAEAVKDSGKKPAAAPAPPPESGTGQADPVIAEAATKPPAAAAAPADTAK